MSARWGGALRGELQCLLVALRERPLPRAWAADEPRANACAGASSHGWLRQARRA